MSGVNASFVWSLYSEKDSLYIHTIVHSIDGMLKLDSVLPPLQQTTPFRPLLGERERCLLSSPPSSRCAVWPPPSACACSTAAVRVRASRCVLDSPPMCIRIHCCTKCHGSQCSANVIFMLPFVLPLVSPTEPPAVSLNQQSCVGAVASLQSWLTVLSNLCRPPTITNPPPCANPAVTDQPPCAPATDPASAHNKTCIVSRQQPAMSRMARAKNGTK